MLEDFAHYLSLIESNPADKKFLLAVSGGLDSAVMTELFRLSAYNYSIAHCNFQLRGKESDEDEKFVKNLAEVNDSPFFSVSFDTEEYAKKNKASVQMAARELRYKWLNEIRLKKDYDYIVTAHHADDAIETFFINLLRGTGISGLRGIKAVNGNIIRPMLTFSRKDILLFAKRRKISWREDSSNDTDKYERNSIRHHLLPALKKVDEGAKRYIIKSMELLASTEEVYRECVKRETDEFVKRNKDKIEINLGLFNKQSHAALYLYEIIKEFEFNYEQAKLIDKCVKKKEHSGKTFYSYSHRIMIDRKSLYLAPRKPEGELGFMMTPDYEMINLNGTFCWFEKLKRSKKFIPDTSPQIASLDYDKLSFPLEVRKWKNGDRFYPLGMNQSKKISDFLIDNKVSILDKERVYVLVSNRKIAWIMGYRIDERFKITEATKNIYLCKLKQVRHE